MPGKGAGPRCASRAGQFLGPGLIVSSPSPQRGAEHPLFQVVPSRGRCLCDHAPLGSPGEMALCTRPHLPAPSFRLSSLQNTAGSIRKSEGGHTAGCCACSGFPESQDLALVSSSFGAPAAHSVPTSPPRVTAEVANTHGSPGRAYMELGAGAEPSIDPSVSGWWRGPEDQGRD